MFRDIMVAILALFLIRSSLATESQRFIDCRFQNSDGRPVRYFVSEVPYMIGRRDFQNPSFFQNIEYGSLIREYPFRRSMPFAKQPILYRDRELAETFLETVDRVNYYLLVDPMYSRYKNGQKFAAIFKEEPHKFGYPAVLYQGLCAFVSRL